ncbi:hypothetical protein [Pumilibacter muris]|uniref:hypothetical protein n=1 Tax=Pumilibacter muris TaxID=2941510 RepID=UPI00203D8231|nr:hypothetical protein [Pumilibacter muris]
MKIFKRIYYPVMAALVVLMLVLGIVDSHVGGGSGLKKSQVDSAMRYASQLAGGANRNEHDSSNREEARDYIVKTLTDAGANKMPRWTSSNDLDDDGKNTVEYFERDNTPVPTVYVQKAVIAQSSLPSDSDVSVARTVENVIFAIPGTSNDAVLLHARYDGSFFGGASYSAAAGSLLQTAVDVLSSGKTPLNTLVFLFGDAGQEGDLGAYAFTKQFSGFDNVSARVRAAADFSAGGTGGTLMMYAGSGDVLSLVGKYSRFNGGTFSSSALPLLFKGSDYSGSGVFGDYNTLNFTNRGGFNEYATAKDSTLNRKLVEQQAGAMNKFVSCYSDSSVAKFDSKSTAVYFSYLDVMTVYYPAAVAFVIAGIILGLVIAIVILNIRNKAFGWGKALAGAAVQLVTLLATSLALLALYYLFALLLSGFGVVSFRSISAVRFAGTGTLLSAAVLAIALAIFFYIILKRTFAVKAVDVVRGNTFIFALVAFVMSFAAPGISYPFTCVALFSLTAMLFTVLFKRKFKEKFKTDIERLFLYVWAIVFSLPLFLPVIYAAQTLFPAVTIVLVLAVVLGLAGFIAPFADYLKPVLDKAFGKLPKRTVRYERVVTERQEDKAKKGKFTEVQVKKIEKVKTPCRYLNRIGISFVAFISAVMVVMFCSFGTTAYSSASAQAYSYYDSIYDDSLLFVYEKNGTASATTTVEVHDMAAYNFIRYAVKDMSWNADKKAYVKNYNGRTEDVLSSSVSDFDKNSSGAVAFKITDSGNSLVTVTLKGASAVKSVIFNKGDENRESEEYTFNEQNEIVFRLPYGYSDFDMTIDASCEIVFEQHIFNSSNISSMGDWDELYKYYLSNSEVGPSIKSGIVLKITKSL